MSIGISYSHKYGRAKQCKHSKGTENTHERDSFLSVGRWRYTCKSCGLNLTCRRCGRSKLSATIKCDHKNG